jgi:uncharacterized protein YceK
MKSIIIGIAILLLTGCASLSYETKDGTKVTYTRLFATNDILKAEVGNAKVEINGQKIDTATLQAIINLIGGTAK